MRDHRPEPAAPQRADNLSAIVIELAGRRYSIGCEPEAVSALRGWLLRGLESGQFVRLKDRR